MFLIYDFGSHRYMGANGEESHGDTLWESSVESFESLADAQAVIDANGWKSCCSAEEVVND